MELVWTMTMDARPAKDRNVDETAAIAASLAGDSNAFSDLVRLHQHRVFRLVGRFFRRREDVEDAAQETFITAWRKLATYKARAPFEHWLTRVCLNCCYARLRGNHPVEQTLEYEPGHVEAPDPGAGIELERLLGHLAPVDRFVLLLLDGEGWSVAEIADKLGWSRVNVKVRAHRARKKLRKLLESS